MPGFAHCTPREKSVRCRRGAGLYPLRHQPVGGQSGAGDGLSPAAPGAGRGIRHTGMSGAAAADAADEQYQQLAHRIQGLDVGRVVAGTNYAAFYPWLSEVIAGFHHAYPGIRVELREGSSTQLGELVDHRRADFCLISQRPGRHEWVPLKDDQLMAILPPTHPLVEADRFPVERLRQEPFIEFLPRQETDNSRMLQQLQIRPKVRFATSDSRAAIAMVRAGLGITLLNDILTADLADGVAVLPLDPPQSVHLGIALPEEEHVSPAAKRFITYALDRLPELDVL